MANHEIDTICPNCGHEYDAHLHWLVCPNCGHETKTIRPNTDAFGLTDQEEADILKQWEDGKKIGCIAIDLGLPADDVIEFLHYQQVI